METDDDAYEDGNDDDDATVRKLSARICQVVGVSDKYLARHTAPAKAVSCISLHNAAYGDILNGILNLRHHFNFAPKPSVKIY